MDGYGGRARSCRVVESPTRVVAGCGPPGRQRIGHRSRRKPIRSSASSSHFEGRVDLVTGRSLHDGESPWWLELRSPDGVPFPAALRFPSTRISPERIATNAAAPAVAEHHGLAAPQLVSADVGGREAGVPATAETVIPGTISWPTTPTPSFCVQPEPPSPRSTAYPSPLIRTSRSAPTDRGRRLRPRTPTRPTADHPAAAACRRTGAGNSSSRGVDRLRSRRRLAREHHDRWPDRSCPDRLEDGRVGQPRRRPRRTQKADGPSCATRKHRTSSSKAGNGPAERKSQPFRIGMLSPH